ncbi:MAG: pyridoxal-phosphate dependent enzyme [Actinobacteria bacterium]|nr:pyridoxal-phosphate dependent enzyme [Actinomycetota bacterium]
MIRSLVDELIVVSEAETKAAMRRLAISDKLVTEGAGAASVAAALKVPLDHRGETVCVVSGGSVDPAVLSSVLS